MHHRLFTAFTKFTHPLKQKTEIRDEKSINQPIINQEISQPKKIPSPSSSPARPAHRPGDRREGRKRPPPGRHG